MRIGITELVVIFVIALLVIGPDKLPEFARKLGEALAQFRRYSEEATRDIKESVVEPLNEAQRPLREAMEPLEELNRSVKENVKDVEQSLRDIGKPRKDPKPQQSSGNGDEQGHNMDEDPSAEVDAQTSLAQMPEDTRREETAVEETAINAEATDDAAHPTEKCSEEGDA